MTEVGPSCPSLSGSHRDPPLPSPGFVMCGPSRTFLPGGSSRRLAPLGLPLLAQGEGRPITAAIQHLMLSWTRLQGPARQGDNWGGGGG